MLRPEEYGAIREGIGAISVDLSNDAVGAQAPKSQDIFAPETHANALDPATPIVVGSRGTGKSFWAGVLGHDDTRAAAAKAYPRLGLRNVKVGFGFTGVGGDEGIGVDAINQIVRPDAGAEEARAFWWTTILRAAARTLESEIPRLSQLFPTSMDWEAREDILSRYERGLRAENRVLLVVYDALDTVATTWPRRRLLTEALLEVVWAMRAYRMIKLKLFLRPDQIDDDALRFVELPKLRTGAVRLTWTRTDLYGLLYARLALTRDRTVNSAFKKLLGILSIAPGDQAAILSRRWSLTADPNHQVKVMEAFAGPYMASGPHGYKKGKTYDWPIRHLADAFNEVTPRSFVGLMIAAAKYGRSDRVISPEGIRNGLRAASKTRVDQLHQEFPWIKGVLAPLDGLLLPQEEGLVFRVWQRAKTINTLIVDAEANKYLPPFPTEGQEKERDLFEALERIGVMFRRKDDRIDMPDLFRVAAKLLKKGGTAPL